jgi:membrane-associated phospholipid phosphatase
LKSSSLGRAALVLLLVASCGTSASAQSPYSLETSREAILFGVGVGGSLAGWAVHDAIVPLTPEEIGALSLSNVPPVDRSATYRYSTAADEASDWLLYGLMASPLALAASRPVREDFGTYGTMYGETLILTLALVELTKGVVSRTRPYVYNPDVPMEEKSDVEARKSFYSSHTAFAYASAVFMSVTFERYNPGSPLRPWIWASSLAAATIVGVLRYTSGSHFPTDILAGAAVGTLAGIAVPALHRVGDDGLALSSAAGTKGVQISFRVAL